MKNSYSRQEINEKIKETFSNNPTSTQIRKIKKLAMSKNIKLGEYRKKFCRKCFSFFNSRNSEIRIKRGFKIIKCRNCNYLNKYKIKN
jgi:RNase P subunit RPR2